MINKIKLSIISIIVFLFLILFNSLLVLNSTFIFKLYMLVSKIPLKLSIPFKAISSDYSSIIYYLQNPFIDKLTFKNFTLSYFGQYHFFEVKRIFLFIYFLLIICSIFFIILSFKKRALIKSSIKYLNYISVLFFTSLFIFFIIDFNLIFTVFHKLLFNNDYWIFNPLTDSIINVLPESFFMLNSIIILLLFIMELIFINKKNNLFY